VITELSSRRPFRAALCGLTACAAATLAAAPADLPPGRIEGLVRLVAAASPPIQSGAYPSRRVSAAPVASPEIAHVVVFPKNPPAGRPPSVTHARMVQQDESFSPKVIAITRGSTVMFPNDDPFFHNVFSLSPGASFDLGRYRRGESRSRTFTRPGLVKVYCHLHSHMAASILVFDHPYFVIPSPDGSFALGNLPAGAYELAAWHERIGESVQTVRVEGGRTARVEFTLPVVDP
jgi:plastocyanin